MLASVGSGAAASWGVNHLGPRIAARDFEPGFYVEHFIKDMGIALREGKRMGLALPGLELAERLYREVAALGHGRSGTQALILALERLAKRPLSDGAAARVPAARDSQRGITEAIRALGADVAPGRGARGARCARPSSV